MSKKKYLCIVSLLIIHEGNADLIHKSVSIPATVEYDDNFSLSVPKSESIYRFISNPQYQISSGDGVSEIGADFALLISRSSKKYISANREDPSLSVHWQTETPNGTFKLNTSYAKSSTRVSELVNSGTVQNDGSTSTKKITGSYQYLLSDRLRLGLDADYTKVDYSGTSLSSYKLPAVTASLNYDYSKLTTTFLRFSASDYQPSDYSANSLYLSAVGGAKYELTNRLNLIFEFGLNQISSKVKKDGYLGDISFTYQYPLALVSANISHTTDASGIGGFITLNQLKAGVLHEISPKSNLSFDISMVKTSGLKQTNLNQLSLSYKYELTPKWNVDLSTSIKQFKNGKNETANGHSIGLTLNYMDLNF